MRIKGLGEAPLPLFATADAREERFSAESIEPSVALRPLSEGREAVEDYRSMQLSPRRHPVSFMRSQLDQMGIVRDDVQVNARDSAAIKDVDVIRVTAVEDSEIVMVDAA